MNNQQGETNQPPQETEAAVTEVNGELAISDELPVKDNEHKANEELRGTQETAGKVSERPITSSRKVEANRRNALKSTGPRTPIGKKTVARNALKDGFYAKWLIIEHPDGKEDPEEYRGLYAALREHYEPVGLLEALWVEKIAVWSWRLRRLIRCESGQIARALAEHSYDLQQSKADSDQPGSAPSTSAEMDSMTDYLFLPAKEDLDKLLRYEAMINKQLNQAIAELERLQGRRKGESSRGNLGPFAKQSQ